MPGMRRVLATEVSTLSNAASVSWSVIASASTPHSPAWTSRASGSSAPSEALLWECRSKITLRALYGLAGGSKVGHRMCDNARSGRLATGSAVTCRLRRKNRL